MINFWLGFLATTMLFACSKKDEKKRENGVPGDVKVAFSNDTTVTLTDMAPTYYGQKIAYISLRGQMTDAIGEVRDAEVVIYGNPGCTFPTMQVLQPHSDKPEDIEVLYEFIGVDSICRNTGEYLNLTQESAAVNAELNAQKYPVPPGIWDRVALNSVVNDAGAPFYKFQAGDMPEQEEVTGTEAGGGISSTLPSPLETLEGDQLEVSISYDLAQGVGFGFPGASNASGGSNCVTVTESETEYCLNPIVITPTATRN